MTTTLTDRIAFLYIVNGEAQLRTGTRRTAAAARKVLKDAAKQAGVEVSTSASDGYVTASVK